MPKTRFFNRQEGIIRPLYISYIYVYYVIYHKKIQKSRKKWKIFTSIDIFHKKPDKVK